MPKLEALCCLWPGCLPLCTDTHAGVLCLCAVLRVFPCRVPAMLHSRARHIWHKSLASLSFIVSRTCLAAQCSSLLRELVLAKRWLGEGRAWPGWLNAARTDNSRAHSWRSWAGVRQQG